jgi:hypothetical protein
MTIISQHQGGATSRRCFEQDTLRCPYSIRGQLGISASGPHARRGFDFQQDTRADLLKAMSAFGARRYKSANSRSITVRPGSVTGNIPIQGKHARIVCVSTSMLPFCAQFCVDQHGWWDRFKTVCQAVASMLRSVISSRVCPTQRCEEIRRYAIEAQAAGYREGAAL